MMTWIDVATCIFYIGIIAVIRNVVATKLATVRLDAKRWQTLFDETYRTLMRTETALREARRRERMWLDKWKRGSFEMNDTSLQALAVEQDQEGDGAFMPER